MKTIQRILVVLMLLMVASSAQAKKQPNILYILVDDMGWRDLGCYGGTFIETPRIDKMASEGMRFTDAYASPVCTPTRASLITGLNPVRIDMWEVIGSNNAQGVTDRPYARYKSPVRKASVPDSTITFGHILQENGYACAHVGKWHATSHTPDEMGFVNIDKKPIKDPKLQKYANANTEWSVGAFTAKAIEFIRENKDRPFIMNVHHLAVHAPIKGRKDLTAKYLKKVNTTGINYIDPEYAAMTEMVDISVGMLLDELENLGIAENTIVIVMGDNGGLRDDLLLNTPLASSMLPLRDQKGCLYEGGIRVPFLVKWPKKIEAGVVCNEPIINYDLYPTFVEIGGAKVERMCDGVNLMPLFKQEVSKLDREAIYWHFPTMQYTRYPQGAMRKGNYKIIENLEDGSVELYDLSVDLGESVNLVDARPEIARELYNELKAWQKSVGAKFPTLNPNYDPLRANVQGEPIWDIKKK